MKVRFQNPVLSSIDLHHFIQLWGQFGTTVGSLLAYEGDFVTISASLWGHFGITFGIIAEPLRVYEGPFAKIRPFRYRFTLFYTIMGPMWGHRGVTFGIWR